MAIFWAISGNFLKKIQPHDLKVNLFGIRTKNIELGVGLFFLNLGPPERQCEMGQSWKTFGLHFYG